MLFLKKRWLRFAALSTIVALSACEEAKEVKSGPADFELVVPSATQVAQDVNGRLVVRVTGSRVSASSLSLAVNGVDVSSRASFASNSIQAAMANLDTLLVPGQNTVTATQAGFNRSETFTFTFDNVIPTLTVTRVTPTLSDASGRPATGSSILVQGVINDPSNIRSIVFTYPNGSLALQETLNTVLTGNQFNNATKTFRVTLPNYPDVAQTPSGAHFSYTITDVLNQTNTIGFLADSSNMVPLAGMQFNDSFNEFIMSYMDAAYTNALSTARTLINALRETNLTPEGQPVGNDATIGQLIENPANELPSVRNATNPPTPNRYGLDSISGPSENPAFPIQQYVNFGTSFCNAPVIRAQSNGAARTRCLLFIRRVNLGTPVFTTSFATDSAGSYVSLESRFPQATVDVEVAAISEVDVPVPGLPTTRTGYRYDGSLKVQLLLRDLKIALPLDIVARPGQFVGFELNRPITISEGQIFGPSFNGSCDPGICADQPTLAWAGLFTNLGFAFVDVNNDGVPDNNAAILQIVAQALNDTSTTSSVYTILRNVIANANLPITGTRTFTPAGGGATKQVDESRQISFSSGGAIDGGKKLRVNIDGRDSVAPANYVSNAVAANVGLGSQYENPGTFSQQQLFTGVRFWGSNFDRGRGGFDMAVAIPSNAVNQRLLADHQSGLFEENNYDITGVSIPQLNIDSTDQLRLSFGTTNAPPVVKFLKQDPISGTFCIIGIGAFPPLCLVDTAHRGFATLTMRNVNFWIENITDGATKASTPAVQVNADIQFIITFGFRGNLPIPVPATDFMRIRMHNVVQPAGMNASMLSDLLDTSMTSWATNGGIEQLTRLAPITVRTTDLGAISIGGVNLTWRTLFSSITPVEYGLIPRWMDIDANGSYLSIGLDVRESPRNLGSNTAGFTAAEQAEHLLQIRVNEI